MGEQRVCLVEKDDKRRRILSAFLTGLRIPVQSVSSLADLVGLEIAPEEPGILIFSLQDIQEQALNNLQNLKNNHPAGVIIALASSASSVKLLPLFEKGIIDQIVERDNPAGLYSAVRTEQQKGRLLKKMENALGSLKREKLSHAADLLKVREMEELFDSTLENFMAALDLRDVETFGHSKTVARYSYVLAEALGIKDPQTLDYIRKGALLHDVGKIAIPDAILKKPGPLSAEEWEVIKRHPALGYGLLKDVKILSEVGNIILCHHEKYDGTGYPKGMKGSAIPLEARIFALADALDALTSHRPYRAPRDFQVAKKEITASRGSHFDPEVVDAFCSLDMAVWEKIRFETTKVLPPIEAYPSFGKEPRPGRPES